MAMVKRGLRPPAPAPAEEETTEGADVGAQEGGEPSEGGNTATPEQQGLYDKLLVTALRLIYSGKTPDGKPIPKPEIMERLALRTEGVDESTQAVTALASVAVQVLKVALHGLEAAGKPVDDPAVKYHAGAEIMEDLAELAGQVPDPKTGKPIHDYSEKEISGAWVRAVDEYQQELSKSGELDKIKPQLQHDWGQVTGAARAGNLEGVIPGLAGAAKAFAPAGPPKMGDRGRK